jgi:hypothetical protein
MKAKAMWAAAAAVLLFWIAHRIGWAAPKGATAATHAAIVGVWVAGLLLAVAGCMCEERTAAHPAER